MIYNNSFNRNVAPIIIGGKRYGRNPLPEDFPDSDKILFDDEKTETALLRIPRQYARTNTPYEKGFEGLDDVECYRLHIFNQVGDPYNTRRDTYIILELPSGLMVPIILYWNGGVDFDPEGRKYINREYDELDRRIIRGFCLKHQTSLKELSHSPIKSKIVDDWVGSYALHCSENQFNKRLPKSGRTGVHMKYLHPKQLKPYEESGIFNNVRFLNEVY